MPLKTKTLITILVGIIFRFDCFAQSTRSAYDPKILILSPAAATVDTKWLKDVNLQNDTIAQMANKVKVDSINLLHKLAGQRQNIKLMTLNGQAYISHLNFFKQISYIAYNYLIYRFYERFPDELIMLKDTVLTPGLAPMEQFARVQQMPYVISFPKVELTTDNGQRSLKITVQLYEQSSNSFLVNDEFVGDERNPGFEFSCKDGTIGCTLNNALAGALQKVIQQIANNNSSIKRQRQLTIERTDAIQKNLFNKIFDGSLVKEVIPVTDSNINLKTLYQCLYNEDNTQFVAFFMQAGVDNKFKSLQDKKDQGKVEIITNKNIGDPGYLDSIPQTYAYIVKGLRYHDKWYYQKDQITYFDAENLADGQLTYLTKLEAWNYFKDDASEYSPEFWNGSLFKKIIDRKKDPNWQKYKDMWETEERENRDYVGMYELVADQIKKEKKKKENIFAENISTTILNPYFNSKLRDKNNNTVSKYSPYSLIFPKDERLAIDPVEVTDKKGQKSIVFFVVMPGDKKIYRWTYFKPFALDEKGYGDSPINKMMASITEWSFAYDTLDDDNFWNNYVLVKTGDIYKYLEPVN